MAVSRTRTSHSYVEESGRVREVLPHEISSREERLESMLEAAHQRTEESERVKEVRPHDFSSREEWLESMLEAAHQRIAVLEETQEIILSRLNDLGSNKPLPAFASWKVRGDMLCRVLSGSAVF